MEYDENFNDLSEKMVNSLSENTITRKKPGILHLLIFYNFKD